MSETRARRRIRKAVESRGFKVLGIEWEPWYNAGEMSGLAGGWTVLTDRPWEPNTNYGDEATGLSVEEVLADVDWTFRPSEPCSCYPNDRERRHPAHTIVGDPERPLHEPDCRWFIRYRLPWWPAPAEVRALPIHRTEAGYPECSTCDGGGCLDCTDPA